jgi:hypothetical protein
VLALGAALTIGFGVLFGGYHWIRSMTTDHTASFGTVMIAILPLIIGVQLLVQAFAMEVVASPGAAETRAYIQELLVAGELR